MAKIANYTEEQVKALVEAYVNAGDYDSQQAVIESFHVKLGKTIASIRAKLTREGVYQKKVATRKNGSKVERKAAKVARIAEHSSRSLEFFDSLEKANATVLDELLTMLD